METTPWIWMDGVFIEWEDAKVHVISHALHYGSGVFEGTRFYETPKGPAIFRLKDHTKRLFYSASTLRLPINFTEEEVNAATIETVRKNECLSGYIRPLAFFGEGKMGLRPQGATPHLIIACWPWGKYLADRPIHVKISKYIRIHPKSLIADAKVAGHYVNSILATQEVGDEDYDEALLLDFEGNIAEGPGENFFLVKDGGLHTPLLGNVLNGITRKSVFQIAQDLGISVSERIIHPEEIWEADEAFFTGTAAEVTPIGTVDRKPIGNGEEGEMTKKIREIFFSAVTGKNQKYEEWLTFV
ncbi:branched-chain amino acid transaminase [Candidatus Peregrinibacteria bacterium]|nr:MAG: branched-chain amino acid transaminase [Candidatus Peregrinibacteria bacterium]